ncbi:hypothetical protein NUSPORA_02103 [Nucleospora cyclopteri]
MTKHNRLKVYALLSNFFQNILLSVIKKNTQTELKKIIGKNAFYDMIKQIHKKEKTIVFNVNETPIYN